MKTHQEIIQKFTGHVEPNKKMNLSLASIYKPGNTRNLPASIGFFFNIL